MERHSEKILKWSGEMEARNSDEDSKGCLEKAV